MELDDILRKHRAWLEGGKGGRKANLSNTDLRDVDLSNADLRRADLRGADLRDADLSNADLRRADLSNADLSNADLRSSDLRGADLRCANLRSAALSRADLRGADLRWVNLRNAGFFGIQTDVWVVHIHTNIIRIGCQMHSHAEWWAFTDEEISRMAPEALTWWRKWKPVIKAIVENLRR